MRKKNKKKRMNKNMKNISIFKSDFLTNSLCIVYSIHFMVFEFNSFM